MDDERQQQGQRGGETTQTAERPAEVVGIPDLEHHVSLSLCG
jgi:hypothetical protein